MMMLTKQSSCSLKNKQSRDGSFPDEKSDSIVDGKISEMETCIDTSNGNMPSDSECCRKKHLGSRWWPVLSGMAVLIMTGIFIFTSLGKVFGETIGEALGLSEDNLFTLSSAMYEELDRWSVANLPPHPQRASWDGETQSRMILAYFDFFTHNSLPPQTSPKTIDGAFIEWLRGIFSKESVLRWPERPNERRNGKGRQHVIEALEKLGERLGVEKFEHDYSTASPPELDEYGLKLIKKIRDSIDFQRWYSSDARTVFFDGDSPSDENHRIFCLRFTQGKSSEEMWYRVRKLHVLLSLWCGVGAPSAGDCSTRPWLVAGSFFEFLSLRRLGFTDSYDKTLIRYFSLDPVLERSNLSGENFKRSTLNESMMDLAIRFKIQDSQNFDDLCSIFAKITTRPQMKWEEHRLGEPSPNSPEERLKKLIGKLRKSAE